MSSPDRKLGAQTKELATTHIVIGEGVDWCGVDGW